MPADRPSRGDIERRAIETYGEPMQMVVCMEECAELIEAICDIMMRTHNLSPLREFKKYTKYIKATCKGWRRCETLKGVVLPKYGRWGRVREEAADVQIMLDQMKMVFGTTLIEEDAKLTRLAGRLEMIAAVGESRWKK